MIPLKMSEEDEARMHDLRLHEEAFLREIERRAGACRERMLQYANEQYPNDLASSWLRRILGGKP